MLASNGPKTITFISRSTPYGSGLAKACLDMVLSAAVFEQKINLVFMDDGVWQLQPTQMSHTINGKNLSAALSALPLYDVNNLYVETASLTQRGLDPNSIAIPVQLCTAQEIGRLIRESDLVYQL
jgi:tRNA 2-thiouridine synthesizing protein C